MLKIISKILKLRSKLKKSYYKFRLYHKSNNLGENIRVHGYSTITTNTTLGNNIALNGLVIVGQGKVNIGNNIQIGPECLIITQNHNYRGDYLPFDATNIVKEVIIEDNVWIGQRVTILPGVTIHEGAIIQAGAVVVKDIPKCAIAGGSPAKPFNRRDIIKYEEMKKNKMFI